MSTEDRRKKRVRDVAHLWADKRVLRFFRKNFDKKVFKNLKDVYMALCEIDSDFNEKKEIGSFTKTVATYSGLYKDTVRPYLRALKNAGLIDCTQMNKGEFGGTTLTMYEFVDDEIENYIKEIGNELSQKPDDGKTRRRENPTTEKSDIGNDSRIKNTTKVVSTNKNSLKDSYESSKENKINCISTEDDDGTSVEDALTSVLLKDGTVFYISNRYYNELQDAFQEIDVLAELKRLRQWNIANPNKRKTRAGIKKHILTWMGKALERHQELKHKLANNQQQPSQQQQQQQEMEWAPYHREIDFEKYEEYLRTGDESIDYYKPFPRSN